MFADEAIDAVIDAARKWDELERKTDEAMPKIKAMIDEAIERQSSTDPDGVGEGWRLLREGEVIREDDEFKSSSFDGGWRKTRDAGSVVKNTYTLRRRRIEPAEAPCPGCGRHDPHCDCPEGMYDKPSTEQGGASTATSSEVTNDKGSGVRDAARPESPEQPAKVRREFYAVYCDQYERMPHSSFIESENAEYRANELEGWNPYIIHYREVLPEDPDPEWTGELIRLCEEWAGMIDSEPKAEAVRAYELCKHLAKRGDK